MKGPVFNHRQEINGVTIYPDGLDSSLAYFGPILNPKVVVSRIAGNRITVYNGHSNLGLEGDHLEDIRRRAGKERLQPLPGTILQSEVGFSFKLQGTHRGNVGILPHLPFPSVSFSVSVDMAAGDAQQLIQELDQKIINNNLLSGKVIMASSTRVYEYLSTLKLPWKAARSRIADALRAEKGSLLNYHTAVQSVISSNIDNWLNVEIANSSQEANAATWLGQKVAEGLLGRTESSVLLDQRLPTSFVYLRHEYELEDRLVAELSVSQEQETLHESVW